MTEWIDKDIIKPNQILVVGCSTSEIAGEQIGTSGSEDIAAIIFQAIQNLSEQGKVHLAFQCCEHLNRALVVEQTTLDAYNLTEVTVIPTREAGGAMASYAYQHMKSAVIVEDISAHAGIDIGQTMIGMHLRPVAIPLRFNQKYLNKAIVTGATTRPKLIGGNRASYD